MNFKALMRMTATALCAVAMFSLASCSNDNDEPNADNGESVNPSNVFQAGLPSKVNGAQIKTNDKGQVTEFKDGNNVISFRYDGTFTPSRANNFTVLMEIRDTEDPTDGSDIYLEINKQGFISYAYQIYLDTEEGTDEWWFGYNNDGQLNYMKRSDYDDTHDITYSDGNISKVVQKEEDGDRREYTVTYTNNTYKTAQVNKGCVMVFDAFGIDMHEMAIAYYAGLLGKATKNLPMGYTLNGLEGGSYYTESENFNWSFNSNNLPTKFWFDGAEDNAITFAW